MGSVFFGLFGPVQKILGPFSPKPNSQSHGLRLAASGLKGGFLPEFPLSEFLRNKRVKSRRVEAAIFCGGLKFRDERTHEGAQFLRS